MHILAFPPEILQHILAHAPLSARVVCKTFAAHIYKIIELRVKRVKSLLGYLESWIKAFPAIGYSTRWTAKTRPNKARTDQIILHGGGGSGLEKFGNDRIGEIFAIKSVAELRSFSERTNIVFTHFSNKKDDAKIEIEINIWLDGNNSVFYTSNPDIDSGDDEESQEKLKRVIKAYREVVAPRWLHLYFAERVAKYKDHDLSELLNSIRDWIPGQDDDCGYDP
jgi:hypothetical protein